MTSKVKAQRPAGEASIRELVDQLQYLDEEHDLGDVKDKAYQKRRDELLQQLGRAKVQARLGANEQVLAEHHCVQAHFPFTGFAFKDVAEESVAFYATDSRLCRWSYLERPHHRLSSLLHEDKLEVVPYDQLAAPAKRREYRWGEAAVALAMVVLALLLWPLLEISGPFLVLVGAAGLVHALLVPTPYWVVAAGREAGEWRVYAARKKSAQQLVGVLRERLPSFASAPEQTDRQAFAAKRWVGGTDLTPGPSPLGPCPRDQGPTRGGEPAVATSGAGGESPLPASGRGTGG